MIGENRFIFRKGIEGPDKKIPLPEAPKAPVPVNTPAKRQSLSENLAGKLPSKEEYANQVLEKYRGMLAKGLITKGLVDPSKLPGFSRLSLRKLDLYLDKVAAQTSIDPRLARSGQLGSIDLGESFKGEGTDFDKLPAIKDTELGSVIDALPDQAGDQGLMSNVDQTIAEFGLDQKTAAKTVAAAEAEVLDNDEPDEEVFLQKALTELRDGSIAAYRTRISEIKSTLSGLQEEKFAEQVSQLEEAINRAESKIAMLLTSVKTTPKEQLPELKKRIDNLINICKELNDLIGEREAQLAVLVNKHNQEISQVDSEDRDQPQPQPQPDVAIAEQPVPAPSEPLNFNLDQRDSDLSPEYVEVNSRLNDAIARLPQNSTEKKLQFNFIQRQARIDQLKLQAVPTYLNDIKILQNISRVLQSGNTKSQRKFAELVIKQYEQELEAQEITLETLKAIPDENLPAIFNQLVRFYFAKLSQKHSVDFKAGAEISEQADDLALQLLAKLEKHVGIDQVNNNDDFELRMILVREKIPRFKEFLHARLEDHKRVAEEIERNQPDNEDISDVRGQYPELVALLKQRAGQYPSELSVFRHVFGRWAQDPRFKDRFGDEMIAKVEDMPGALKFFTNYREAEDLLNDRDNLPLNPVQAENFKSALSSALDKTMLDIKDARVYSLDSSPVHKVVETVLALNTANKRNDQLFKEALISQDQYKEHRKLLAEGNVTAANNALDQAVVQFALAKRLAENTDVNIKELREKSIPELERALADSQKAQIENKHQQEIMTELKTSFTRLYNEGYLTSDQLAAYHSKGWEERGFLDRELKRQYERVEFLSQEEVLTSAKVYGIPENELRLMSKEDFIAKQEAWGQKGQAIGREDVEFDDLAAPTLQADEESIRIGDVVSKDLETARAASPTVDRKLEERQDNTADRLAEIQRQQLEARQEAAIDAANQEMKPNFQYTAAPSATPDDLRGKSNADVMFGTLARLAEAAKRNKAEPKLSQADINDIVATVEGKKLPSQKKAIDRIKYLAKWAEQSARQSGKNPIDLFVEIVDKEGWINDNRIFPANMQEALKLAVEQAKAKFPADEKPIEYRAEDPIAEIMDEPQNETAMTFDPIDVDEVAKENEAMAGHPDLTQDLASDVAPSADAS